MSANQKQLDPCCPPGSIPGGPHEHSDHVTTDIRDTSAGSSSLPDFSNAPLPHSQLQGRFVTINDNSTSQDKTPLPCYFVEPKSTADSKGDNSTKLSSAILVYTDIYGTQSRILQIADWLAETCQASVLVCDIFRGETRADHPTDMLGWFSKVPYEGVIRHDTEQARNWLQEQFPNISKFSALGFCWGAWAIARTCRDFSWESVVAAHPSFKVEAAVFQGDPIDLMQSMVRLRRESGNGTKSLLLMPAENDPHYTKPSSPEVQVMQQESKDEFTASTPKCSVQSLLFDQQKHGWMTRGDWKDLQHRNDVHRGLEAMARCFA